MLTVWLRKSERVEQNEVTSAALVLLAIYKAHKPYNCNRPGPRCQDAKIDLELPFCIEGEGDFDFSQMP